MRPNEALQGKAEAQAPLLLKSATSRLGWRAVVDVMTRPQSVTIPMVVLFSIIPLYLFIGTELIPAYTLHTPELELDRAISLWPAWSVMYGSLFLAVLLPIFVIHQQELIRRTVLAFLLIWLFSYACFIAYPTVSLRPATVAGDGFFIWTLQIIYDSDIRYNCFPSLHVAQCLLAALACYRVHRGVGIAAVFWAFLVGLSTLYTKQHYIVDVIAGLLLAYIAYYLLLRSFPRKNTPEHECLLAPTLALCAVGIYLLFVAGFLLIYAINAA